MKDDGDAHGRADDGERSEQPASDGQPDVKDDAGVEFLDSTAGAESLPSPFVDIGSLGQMSTQSNSQSRVGMEFASGESTKGDIFVISVRYDVWWWRVQQVLVPRRAAEQPAYRLSHTP
jgi:hypothetical protein